MNLDFDYYNGKDLIYPQKPSKPSLGRNPSAAEARDYANAIEIYEREFESYTEDRAWYSSQMQNRQQELMDRLRNEYDITEAQLFILWNKAYEDGHSEGLNRVVAVFDELYEVASEFAALEKG